MRRSLSAALLLCVVSAVAVTGCGSGDDGANEGRLRVVASTTQIADLARQVGGDRVEVTSILQPGTDVHDFEPRPSDAKAFAEADVVLVNGLGLDPWAAQLTKSSGGEARTVDLSQGLPVSRAFEEPEGHDHEEGEEHAEGEDDERGEDDPHWWNDPRNGAAASKAIAKALGAASADDRAAFDDAAAEYVGRLSAVDAAIAKCLDAIPARQRKLVSNHEAFGLFAARYDIEFVGAVIPANTTQAQGSAGELAELRETIRDEGVKAVFPETSVNAKVSRALARESGVRSDLVLYGDSLGEEGSPAGTYAGMLAANADTLARGFSGDRQRCEVPAAS